MKKKETSRLIEIDFLRAFACLSVIMIHVTGQFALMTTANIGQIILEISLILVNVFSHQAVPLFIFISGFVLFFRYSSKFPLSLFYRKRIASILPQYLIFSYLYLAYSKKTFNFSLNIFLENFLYSKSFYHLWFFAVILQFYLVYPLIVKLYSFFKNKQKIHLFLFFCLGWQIFWNLLFANRENKGVIFLPILLGHLIYFVFGILVADHYLKFKNQVLKIKTIIPLTLSLLFTAAISSSIILGLKNGFSFYEIPFYYLRSNIFLSPVFYLVSFSLIYQLLNWLKRFSHLSKFLASVSKYSYPIYLIHPFWLDKVIIFLDESFKINYNFWFFYPILYLSTLVLSFLSASFLSVIPYIKLEK